VSIRSKMKALLEAVDLSGARWFVNKYGISAKEAAKLVGHPKQKEIIREIEDWREKHGFPAPNSPIARGKLMAILKKA